MCCVCDDSSLGLSNVYWFPHQWDRAMHRAIAEGRSTRVKHRVRKQVFANGKWGWVIRR